MVRPPALAVPTSTDAAGDCIITKADATGGCVDEHTVKEQLLYELHDPAAYLTPDVTADFTGVRVAQADTATHQDRLANPAFLGRCLSSWRWVPTVARAGDRRSSTLPRGVNGLPRRSRSGHAATRGGSR